LDARLTILLCTRIIVAKSEEVKTECKLAGSSKEGYGSQWAVLPMMIMMIYRRLWLTMGCFANDDDIRKAMAHNGLFCQ
jgi:hypothetical protein